MLVVKIVVLLFGGLSHAEMLSEGWIAAGLVGMPEYMTDLMHNVPFPHESGGVAAEHEKAVIKVRTPNLPVVGGVPEVGDCDAASGEVVEDFSEGIACPVLQAAEQDPVFEGFD